MFPNFSSAFAMLLAVFSPAIQRVVTTIQW